MPFLSAADEQAVRHEFEKMTGPVKLAVFASELGGENNQQTVALVRRSPRCRIGSRSGAQSPHRARAGGRRYGMDVTPAIVVEGAADYGIRFLGIPAGYEFANLIDSIIVASTGEPALSEDTRAALEGLGEDVTIKVFTTPT